MTKPYQSPGRMINSYYYIAPVGDWTRDLPHTVASNMVMVSQDLNQSATDGCRVYFYKLIGTYRRTCELVNIICEHMIIDLTNKMWVCTDLANRGQKTVSHAVTVLKSWSKHVMTTHDWISLFSWFAWCCSYQNHSSRGTGRILLQVKFFFIFPNKIWAYLPQHWADIASSFIFILSQQILSIAPAALGGYCFKWSLFFILSQQNLSIAPAALGGYCFKWSFFYILSQQNLSIAPAALGGYCFKWSLFYILSQQNLSIAPAALGGYCFKWIFFYPNKMWA